VAAKGAFAAPVAAFQQAAATAAVPGECLMTAA
jgi:hypothetical protein